MSQTDRPATLAELEAFCFGAPQWFIDEQLRRRAPPTEARAAWIPVAEELKRARQRRQRGVEPFTTNSAAVSEDSDDTVSEFMRLRNERIARGEHPLHAAAAVARQHPRLHIQSLLATNSKKGAKQLVDDLAETYEV